MDLDTCWCPVCDKQIQPKRYQVPIQLDIHQPNITSPPPPPSSPQDEPRRKLKPRQRLVGGGLVQGTGRVKPNGAIRQPSPPKQQQAQLKPKVAVPVKYRTVIDQGPLPLFCSDQCRQIDWDRHNPPSPISDDSPPSSLESDSSLPSPPTPQVQPEDLSPSIATLARIYNFPPLPPITDLVEEPPAPKPLPLNSTITMVSKHLEALVPKKSKKCQYGPYREPPEPIKIVPGWNDGTSRWRACVYGFAPAPATLAAPLLDDELPAPYKTCVATPHRGRGNKPASVTPRAPERPVAQQDAETHDLLAMYEQSFKRQVNAPRSISPPRRRERSLVHPDARGKLLVPNVKMTRVNSAASTTSPDNAKVMMTRVDSAASTASLESSTSTNTAPSSASPPSRRGVRSPLHQSSESDDFTLPRSDGDAPFLGALTPRPTFETRSWSYDNVKTYPFMKLPPKKAKKIVKEVVDGVEKEVEVEYEVPEVRKRLFLFADTVVRRK